VELSAAANVSGTNQRARVDRDAGLLVGSGCGVCGATSWPPRAICHRCGNPIGQIEIGDAMFFGHVRELPAGATVPMPVRVVVAPNGTGTLSFWFEPA
jgi:uncharacterized OB-fold protein